MAVPKANQKAVNRYIAKNYDRINVTIPKGTKEKIKEAAERNGESVNAYIARLIFADMKTKGVDI